MDIAPETLTPPALFNSNSALGHFPSLTSSGRMSVSAQLSDYLRLLTYPWTNLHIARLSRFLLNHSIYLMPERLLLPPSALDSSSSELDYQPHNEESLLNKLSASSDQVLLKCFSAGLLLYDFLSLSQHVFIFQILF
ncbi:unnamed protein product [Protopolystoma xenopodis]|uniref:Uncharacterized protein n=1 Tax=Protopolystoma xenopodis TaxID=117903 RepID=A0A3S5B183_9PLAT|nr:unnamed protein product [Protopolystoma xenopodis]